MTVDRDVAKPRMALIENYMAQLQTLRSFDSERQWRFSRNATE